MKAKSNNSSGRQLLRMLQAATSFVFLLLLALALSQTQSSAVAVAAASADDTCSPASSMDGDSSSSACLSTVGELLARPDDQILTTLGGLYEHSPWVAEIFLETTSPQVRSGMSTLSELAGALKAIVDEASQERKLGLLQAHPDLAAKVETLKTLTADSQDEQNKAGLQSLEGEELATFTARNNAYKAKFGLPFILAVRNASKDTVLSALRGRLGHTPQQEFATALEQVHKIAWMRLQGKINSDDAEGFLTCHVLDTAAGTPAAGMRITLTRLTPEDKAGVVGRFVTNDDGRLEGGPALKGGKEFIVGTYEWTFYAGDYFASQGTFTSGTPFLDIIPLRFGIDNPDDHYHVPLLVSPWSFSTYRGS